MFKTRKAKQFNVQPRYYNEEKEELEKRRARIEKELSGDNTYPSSDFQSNLKEKWQRNKKTSHFSAKPISSVITIAVLLGLIAYYIIYL